MKKDPKKPGTPRAAMSLGMNDPRARNAALLKFGPGFTTDKNGYIVPSVDPLGPIGVDERRGFFQRVETPLGIETGSPPRIVLRLGDGFTTKKGDLQHDITDRLRITDDGKLDTDLMATDIGVEGSTDIDVQAALNRLDDAKQNKSEKGQPNGYAGLDASGKVPLTQLPELYAVGAIYPSFSATNPNTFLGYGTWSLVAQGRFLVGLDSGDADFDMIEETGGAKTHTH